MSISHAVLIFSKVKANLEIIISVFFPFCTVLISTIDIPNC
jgi:hypothetical protein